MIMAPWQGWSFGLGALGQQIITPVRLPLMWPVFRISRVIHISQGQWTSRISASSGVGTEKQRFRAKEADFDIVYVYATHGYLLSHFLSAETNTRTDEYGGSLENRTRLLRELIEDTKEAVGDRCAVAVRYSVGGDDGETPELTAERRDRLEMLAELPDLWDININNYYQEMGVSRFFKEGSLEKYMSFVKSVTTKPVVTVGRFTSPETMTSQVRRGIVDFIGAARPSIADPF